MISSSTGSLHAASEQTVGQFGHRHVLPMLLHTHEIMILFTISDWSNQDFRREVPSMTQIEFNSS